MGNGTEGVLECEVQVFCLELRCMSLVGGDWPDHVGESVLRYIDIVGSFTFNEEHITIPECDLYDMLSMIQ